jgi:hypothetical protein
MTEDRDRLNNKRDGDRPANIGKGTEFPKENNKEEVAS